MPLALFDLDNTLFDRAGTFRHWATRYVDEQGLDPGEVDWFVHADQDGLGDKRVLWTLARERYRLQASVETLLEAYRHEFQAAITADLQVWEALGLLRNNGWRMGIVTNGAMPNQAEKAGRAGLLECVDGFCASGDFGVEKPDARIFHEVVRRCAPSTEPVVMIGDSARADVAGARALGFAVEWMDRGRIWDTAEGPPPELIARTVSEAASLVLALSGRRADRR